MPTAVVVGASPDRSKFGNKAVRSYLKMGWTVVPVHPREAAIEGCQAVPSLRDVHGPVERVLFYVPPQVGLTLLADVATLAPDEFWVNPGAESPELVRQARELGLDPIMACAIVDVGDSPANHPA